MKKKELNNVDVYEDIQLTKDYILKGQVFDKENPRKYSGYDEDMDFNVGCTISPRCGSEDGFVYIATYFDIHHNDRPKEFQFKFYDKKIGVANDVYNRMKVLTEEIKIGRYNKIKSKKTHTPLMAKAIKCWRMDIKNAYRFEYYIHRLFENRNTSGEWFTDYNEDILNIVNNEITKFVNNGAVVELCHMDEELSKNIHRFEKINPTIEVSPTEYSGYKL
jgi:hypothetical protein